jgi:hypothetical protein
MVWACLERGGGGLGGGCMGVGIEGGVLRVPRAGLGRVWD